MSSIEENEVGTLKRIGDACLEKGKLTRNTTLLAYAIGLYKNALGRCTRDTDEHEALLHRIGYTEKTIKQIFARKAKTVSPSNTGIHKPKTKLSTIAEEFRKLDLAFKGGADHDLDVVERGYSRKLIHAISRADEVLEREALKSLGDLYLHKAKINRNKLENFNKACALYEHASHYCTHQEEKQVVEHRIEYAEKCTKLVHCRSSTQADIRSSTNSSTVLTVSTELHKLKEETKLKGHGVTLLIEAYTKRFLRAIVDRNKLLEIESLKALADLYLEEKGRVGKDSVEINKAAGLYRAAMDRCEDSDGRETLKHRIKYAEKVKEQGTKKRREMGLLGNRKVAESPPSTSQASYSYEVISQISRPGMLLAPGNTTLASDERREDTDSTYEDHLQEGCRALQKGDLDNAEQAFAAALKSVHVKDSSTGQYRKETEPLHKLGHVYMKRGILSKDGDDFSKSAALCNAALVRASREDNSNIKQTILKITQSFVKYVLSIEQVADVDHIEKHKSMLKEHREYVEEEIKRIDHEVDPYSLDDDDPSKREVEQKRAEAIKELFQIIVHQRRTFMAGLVDECTAIMGPPPCTYAMIGLGSQATGLVTPYSDLEFAILIDKETKNNVKYFRNFTHYLHLKVINLGETIIPAMAIKSLNDFHSEDPLDNWFYDSVTPRGFAFDGSMPHACKTPLGRGKTCELIHTPSNMTNILKNDLMFHLKKGYHLASILGNVCLIAGDQGLVDLYSSLWTEQLERNNLISILQAFAILTEDANAQTFKVLDLTASLLNVKKEIYRFSTLALSCWALLCGIQPTTVWETIQKMNMEGIVDSENAHHLMVLVSISAELRLRTYMNNRGQLENMSALSSMSTGIDISEKLMRVFYFSNAKQIMRYYYTARPLKYFISQFSEMQPLPREPSILFDNSPTLQWEVYRSLCDYEKSKTCAEEALQSDLSKYGEGTVHLDIADSLYRVGDTWGYLGDHKKAVSYYERSLQMMRSIHGEDTPHPDIVGLLNNLGKAWNHLGDYRKAAIYIEQSLQLMKSIYGETHINIAGSLGNLGNAKGGLGDYESAVSCHEQSLEMMRGILGESTTHSLIAGTLLNLGAAWSNLGDYRKAVSCFEQSLQMSRGIYGETTAHPEIAQSLDNLGNAWSELGDFRKATSYYEQSIQMKWGIYGESYAHPSIADTISNLGSVWNERGDHRKAKGYCEQSLQMLRSIYGERKEHPTIAKQLQNLGATWKSLGDPRKAISYLEESLQMMRRIYGTAHPDITTSLNNLGEVWGDLGDDRKAVGFYEEALQMRRRIYGESTPHPSIARSLGVLGSAWTRLGDYEKAVSYHEQSLQIFQSIHGVLPHDDIAQSLSGLGTAWLGLGNHGKAITFLKQSTQMMRSIHGEGTKNPLVARSLSNLGKASLEIGDHGNAISYFEQSLEMKRSIHGRNTAHPDIANLLYGLAIAWTSLRRPERCVSYLEQTLQMKRRIYGESTAHPEINQLTEMLAELWRKLGDHRKAASYRDQLPRITP
ncbi:uncharacterized protein LOC144919358 [Branchiostoma floridae x Branchiostoma belcheri]